MPAGSSCSSCRELEGLLSMSTCSSLLGTHGSGIDSLDLRSRECQGSSTSCWHESTSNHTLLLISVICPLTICTYIIWGSSGPNKSHVLITFDGVMTSGLQPIFIWFQSKGQRTGYASDTFQLSSSPYTCLLCFYFRERTMIFGFPKSSNPLQYQIQRYAATSHSLLWALKQVN